ncbi:MAG TPA: alginate lyase family protein, partial [Anaerohalosphaeraceae bacterium]|nr:alginate lyase family protein [Anaerohalosphaeraceae bacterium]
MRQKVQIVYLIVIGVSVGLLHAAFHHPGLLHSRQQLDFIKNAVAAGQQPWLNGYKQLAAHPQASYQYTVNGGYQTVGRGRNRTDNVHKAEFDADCNAAHYNALMWYLTDDRRHADKAIEILNAYARTLKEIIGTDKILMASLNGAKLTYAAELMRYTNAGWDSADSQQFETLLLTVFYPVIRDFAPFANGNWSTGCVKTMMAIGVFCERQDIFDRAADWYRSGTDNGSVLHYISENGQCQESGRDQQHAQLGLAHLAEACEIAWNQGLDLYGWADNRLLKGFEYTARYNLGYEVPFVPLTDRTGRYYHSAISEAGRGNLRPVWEMVYNHYQKRRGLDCPYVRQAAEKLRPEGAGPYADCCGFGTLLFTLPADRTQSRQSDSAGFENWTGFKHCEQAAEGGQAVFTLTIPGRAECVTNRWIELGGWEMPGLDAIPESRLNAADLREYQSVCFTAVLSDDRSVRLRFSVWPHAVSRGEYPKEVASTVVVSGKGPHDIVLPLEQFEYPKAMGAFWKFIQKISLSAEYVHPADAGRLQISGLRLSRGELIKLSAPVKSKPCQPGQTVQYGLTAENLTDRRLQVRLFTESYGWEALQPELSTLVLQLEPHASEMVSVSVTMTDDVAPGGRQTHMITAVADGRGDLAERVQLTTVRYLAHPYILHTESGWNEVKSKIDAYPWAQQALTDYSKQASVWQVPAVHSDTGYVYPLAEAQRAVACAVAWKLTGSRAWEAKAVAWIRQFADPDKGYLKTQRACNAGRVHEGLFFQEFAKTYDLLYDSTLLTSADHQQIEKTLRKFLEIADWDLQAGDGNNHQISFCAGALLCSLTLQDFERAERFLNGPHGLRDLLASGILDDGSYFEQAPNYNILVANIAMMVVQACRPWGLGLDRWTIEPRYSRTILLAPWINDNQFLGMSFDRYGPSRRNYRTIKDLWDSLVPLADYRGVLFAGNDSAEKDLASDHQEAAPGLELAYYLYRDPNYIPIIRNAKKRNLLYGVPNLPQTDWSPWAFSVCQDNSGFAVLRSQPETMQPRQRIQAVLKFGTHGGYHGHFDRASLMSLMRYGRSFYSTEAAWYGYDSYLFKMWVQASVSHNMVVVDQRMQKPAEGKLLLFYPGRQIQAAAAETSSQWIDPPYGGQTPYRESFPQEKSWKESRYLPIPDVPRPQGDTGLPSEPVLQRRLMVVTQDYVIVADFLKGSEEHTFDNLIHIKGLKDFHAAAKVFRNHTDQFSADPFGAGQFITNCDWYQVETPAVCRFQMDGPQAGGSGTLSEPGPLKMDVHLLWPQTAEMMVADYPENLGTAKKLWYAVRADGQTLAEGRFGAWILGADQIDVALEGKTVLELETRVDSLKNKTIFWAEAVIVTADGKEIPLTRLPLQYEGLIPTENFA